VATGGSKPKKKPFMTVGVPGVKKPAQAPGTITNPTLARNPKETPLGAAPLGATLPGRPVSNVGSYLLKPTSDGYEILNETPDIIDKVHKDFLRKFQLPPALQPKYLRKPEVLDKNRANNISRGWRKPRSQQG
jgi:hypothetical protein